MSETVLAPMLDEAQIQENFAKIKPRMTDNEAIIEASRCLFCHDAPCVQACPTSIDIPMFIRQIASRNVAGAAKTIFSSNIIGKSCAYACPTEVLCEGSCVYHHLNDKVIDIGRLQGYATDYAIDHNLQFFTKGTSKGKKVAVVGGGPGGLACAHELTVLGYDVVVYESNPKPGGLNMYGVAPYKISNEDAQREVDYVSQIGFDIRTSHRVVSDPNITEPRQDGQLTLMPMSYLEQTYDAIFLAVGLGRSVRPEIPGCNLPNVVGAAEFIHQLRERNLKIPVGRKVVVIGGGNTAIDAAVETTKLGADVTVVYRRSEEDASAYYFEVDLARRNGVKFQFLTSPVEILGTDAVECLVCRRNKLIPSANGAKPGMEPIEGSEFSIPCDMVIFATGQEKMLEFYEAIPNLTLDRGKVQVNADFQTSHPKIFAGGDCINGGKEVVNAVADGRDAARGIDRVLSQKQA